MAEPDDWRSGQDEDIDDFDPLLYSEGDADNAREHNYRVEETV